MADLSKRGPDCDSEGGERGERGERGKRGKRGRDGHDGQGATGPTGANGAAGSSSTIIPFASGPPVELTTLSEGGLGTGAVIGFCDANANVVITNPLNLLDPVGGVVIVPFNMAFSMPRDGTLVQLSAYFSLANALDLSAFPGSQVDIRVEVWSSPTPNDSFTPTGLGLELPFTGGVLLNIGTFGSNTSGPVAIPVANQERILLLAVVSTTGIDEVITFEGFLSAGLAIE